MNQQLKTASRGSILFHDKMKFLRQVVIIKKNEG